MNAIDPMIAIHYEIMMILIIALYKRNRSDLQQHSFGILHQILDPLQK